jgi:hypothetical protein
MCLSCKYLVAYPIFDENLFNITSLAASLVNINFGDFIRRAYRTRVDSYSLDCFPEDDHFSTLGAVFCVVDDYGNEWLDKIVEKTVDMRHKDFFKTQIAQFGERAIKLALNFILNDQDDFRLPPIRPETEHRGPKKQVHPCPAFGLLPVMEDPRDKFVKIEAEQWHLDLKLIRRRTEKMVEKPEPVKPQEDSQTGKNESESVLVKHLEDSQIGKDETKSEQQESQEDSLTGKDDEGPEPVKPQEDSQIGVVEEGPEPVKPQEEFKTCKDEQEPELEEPQENCQACNVEEEPEPVKPLEDSQTGEEEEEVPFVPDDQCEKPEEPSLTEEEDGGGSPRQGRCACHASYQLPPRRRGQRRSRQRTQARGKRYL